MESLHYLLMKCNAMFARKILSGVSKIGLTSGQPKVLDFLWQVQEADQKTIAAHCEIEPATVGSILLRMENAGLVIRRNKEGNRRSLYVSLTEEGREAAKSLQEIFKSVEEEAMQDLTEQERQMLEEILSKMCCTMQEERERA
ncbi:MAG TPA: MarR family transcriptional regulator [Candidatus Blautia gallistercoris]|uniref:MarR family transcriptional regulator n=1 Tax=Candidatus Blautia gallistercoris TaxID=2838490 RepID=A0A9D1WGA5_9FIRM|nr:MarR family transcriptional regulator [Candidatus Blautia gallistercoris]